MILNDCLFKLPDVDIFRIDESSDLNSDDLSEISLTPLHGRILSEEHSDVVGVLDGYFIVKATRILKGVETSTCYINLTCPERISDYAFLLIDGEVVRKPKYEIEDDIVPAIGIECNGIYDLFYSRSQPEIGLSVLRSALEIAKSRAPIAEDLAYILRDENRVQEAISAFSIVIEEGEPHEYTFSERAALYAMIGDAESSARDYQKSNELIAARTKNFSTYQ